MKKRIASLILVLVMVVGFMPTISFASEGIFAGGSGTESDPFLISTKAHLNNVREYLDSYFRLTCDIEFTDADFAEGGDFYNDGAGFEPIGNDLYEAFTGSFDGNGFAIKNLYVNISTDSLNCAAGLFGYNSGVIKNLGMLNATILGFSAQDTIAGVIAGKNHRGTIENCYNTGKVSATGLSDSSNIFVLAGGIAGESSEGTIKNCYNTGEISAISSTTALNSNVNVGGIIGYSYKDVLTDCYNEGDILGYSNISACVGGIAGNNYISTFKNCYNVGKVLTSVTDTPSSYEVCGKIGGIAGEARSGIIENCYNTGAVSVLANATNCSAEAYSGGIVGYNFYKNVITNCYNTGTVSSYSSKFLSSGGIAGCNKGIITLCYNIGVVTGYSDLYDYPASIANGIVGEHQDTLDDDFVSKVENCYYLDNVLSGTNYGGGVTTKCTAEQMKKQETFKDFDFENIWTMEGDSLYPFPTLKGILMYDFIDVPVNAWYKTYVDYAVENGIFAGKGDGKFEPEANITRAEFVQVLANLSKVDTSNKKIATKFKDVKSGQWYAPAVKWASDNKIVSGKSADTFDPNTKITREEMCVMLVNYANFKGITLKTKENKQIFADDSKISSWAKDRVYMCQMADIVNGKGANKFDAVGTAIRAEAATIFTLFYKEYLK